MSQQNFVEQFRLFMEYARKNSMHSRECMLWVSLFYLANEEATYNADTQTYEWPDGFFEVSNGELNSYGKFDKQAVESLRNRLKQRGLIDFVKGNRNSATPMYRIHYFIRFGNKIIPNNTPNAHSNDIPNHIPNNTPNAHSNNMPTIPPTYHPYSVNINNNIPYDSSIGDYYDDEEDDEEEQSRTERARAQARAREEALEAWRACYGSEPTPVIIQGLAERCVMYGFEDGVLAKAIELAAWRNAKSPADFILVTMADWYEHRVRTVGDVEEYAALYDARNGRLGPEYQTGAEDRLRKFAEDRETEEQRAERLVREQRRREREQERNRAIQERVNARIAEKKAERERADEELVEELAEKSIQHA